MYRADARPGVNPRAPAGILANQDVRDVERPVADPARLTRHVFFEGRSWPLALVDTCQALGVGLSESMFVADGAFTELDAAQSLGMVAVKIEQANQSGDYGTSTSFDHRIEQLTEVLDLLP